MVAFIFSLVQPASVQRINAMFANCPLDTLGNLAKELEHTWQSEEVVVRDDTEMDMCGMMGVRWRRFLFFLLVRDRTRVLALLPSPSSSSSSSLSLMLPSHFLEILVVVL